MKPYLSIPHVDEADGRHCYAFVKYDGSNLRFEYSAKRGWYKYGTRSVLFDRSSETYGPAIQFFLDKYGSGLERVFKTSKPFKKAESVIVYAEWFGAKSFAGQHVEGDPKDLVLFDVNPHKKGLLGPEVFLGEVGHLGVAEVLYEGRLTDEFVAGVRDGSLPVASQLPIRTGFPEGVIVKAGDGHKLWYGKIKTQSYMAELKRVFPQTWQTLV